MTTARKTRRRLISNRLQLQTTKYPFCCVFRRSVLDSGRVNVEAVYGIRCRKVVFLPRKKPRYVQASAKGMNCLLDSDATSGAGIDDFSGYCFDCGKPIDSLNFADWRERPA
jgi:hypothetical protein